MLGRGAFIERLRAEEPGFLSEDFRRTFNGQDIAQRAYCAVRNIGDSSSRTAQSGGESDEGRRSAPLGRVPATKAWVRGED